MSRLRQQTGEPMRPLRGMAGVLIWLVWPFGLPEHELQRHCFGSGTEDRGDRPYGWGQIRKCNVIRRGSLYTANSKAKWGAGRKNSGQSGDCCSLKEREALVGDRERSKSRHLKSTMETSIPPWRFIAQGSIATPIMNRISGFLVFTKLATCLGMLTPMRR